MFQKDLDLADLVNLDEWQSIQDSFAEVIEISLRTVSLEGTPLTKTSHPTRLCSDILPNIPNVNKLCAACFLRDDAKLPLNGIKNDTNIKCPFGLEAYIIPVTAIGNKVVAYLVVGPVILKARKAISEYEKDAKRFGIKLDELMDAIIEINVFSYNKIYNVLNLIRTMSSYLAQTGYHKKRLGEIAPEVVELDPIFSRYYEEKILHSLLDSCALALEADSGSVMTVDKNTNMLHIKVATKLDKDIINKTSVKVGDGIAGVAAATSKTIVLPKDEKQNGLSGKMKRRYIKSSLIMPFNKGNAPDVYGVINLNIVRKNVDFSQRDIALVKELVKMASVALTPFR